MYKCVFSFAEIGHFQKIVGGLIELVDELAKEAETEKMKVSLAAIQREFHSNSPSTVCGGILSLLIYTLFLTTPAPVCAGQSPLYL